MKWERTSSMSLLLVWLKKKLRPLCLTPQSQKINTQASVSHVEGSTEHLIWIEFPASEWTKGTKNASRGWRGTQKKKWYWYYCLYVKRTCQNASFTSIKSGKPKETCRVFFLFFTHSPECRPPSRLRDGGGAGETRRSRNSKDAENYHLNSCKVHRERAQREKD